MLPGLLVRTSFWLIFLIAVFSRYAFLDTSTRSDFYIFTGKIPENHKKESNPPRISKQIMAFVPGIYQGPLLLRHIKTF